MSGKKNNYDKCPDKADESDYIPGVDEGNPSPVFSPGFDSSYHAAPKTHQLTNSARIENVTFKEGMDIDDFLRSLQRDSSDTLMVVSNPQDLVTSIEDQGYFKRKNFIRISLLFTIIKSFANEGSKVLRHALQYTTFEKKSDVKTELMRAAEMNDVSLVREILDIYQQKNSKEDLCAYINHNANDPSWRYPYPLHTAILNGNFDMFKILLDRGADTTVEGDKGHNALQCALKIWSDRIGNEYSDSALSFGRSGQKSNMSMQQYIYGSCEDYEKIFTTLLKHNSGHMTPEERMRYIHFAINSNNFDAIVDCIKSGWDLFVHSTQSLSKRLEANSEMYRKVLGAKSEDVKKIMCCYFNYHDIDQSINNHTYGHILGLMTTGLDMLNQVSNAFFQDENNQILDSLNKVLFISKLDYGLLMQHVFELPWIKVDQHNYMRAMALFENFAENNNIKGPAAIVNFYHSDMQKNMFLKYVDKLDEEVIWQTIEKIVQDENVSLLCKVINSQDNISIGQLREKGIFMSVWMCCKLLFTHPLRLYEYLSSSGQQRSDLNRMHSSELAHTDERKESDETQYTPVKVLEEKPKRFDCAIS